MFPNDLLQKFRAALGNNGVKGMSTIDYAHAEIHEGSHFVCSHVEVIDTTTKKFGITVADNTKWPHMLFEIQANGELEVTVTEGADRTLATELPCINRNRNSANVPTLKVYDVVSAGTTDGAVTILTIHAGATGVSGKTTFGGGARSQNEYMLKQNTKYVISVTTLASTTVTFGLDWYEHTSN
jgi:hypothetical protein